MIARKFLIPLRKEYFKIRCTGQWIKTPFFDVIICPNDKGYGRFAIVVSKKTALLSVERHKIKRQLALICQETKTNKDLVFIAKKEITNRSLAEIKNEISRLNLN